MSEFCQTCNTRKFNVKQAEAVARMAVRKLARCRTFGAQVRAKAEIAETKDRLAVSRRYLAEHEAVHA